MTVIKVATEHSAVGPSSIADTILCPGRVGMQRGLEDITSFAAAQGTVAHSIGESRLNGKRYPKLGTIIVQDGHDIEIDKEMINAVRIYESHIKNLQSILFESKEEKIEGKVSLDHVGIPEIYGTVDYSLSIPFKTLYVRDYKHGTGITVEADNNEQLMCYALGAAGGMIETYEIINIGIVQPRTRDGEQIKIWETTPDVLLTWSNDVLKPTVKLALSDNAPLIPGEKQCQWCRAKGVCPALAKQALTVAQADFANFADFTPDEIVDTVSIEKITKIYKQLPLLKSFIKAVEARIYNSLAVGEPVEGYKLVNGRRSRSWLDAKKAEIFLQIRLGKQAFERKLLSPAQAEKVIDRAEKEELNSLIATSIGKPSIVEASDKREAITTAKNDFSDYAN